jgi:hypothetical protein
MANQDQDNSRWEIEYKDILDNVTHSLRNEDEDSEGKWKSKGAALMNDEGISHFISYLKLVLHRGIALSNITEIYAKDVTMRLGKSYKNELIIKWQDWGCKKEYVRSISTLFHTNVYAVLSRAIKGREQVTRAKKMKFLDHFKRSDDGSNSALNDWRI